MGIQKSRSGKTSPDQQTPDGISRGGVPARSAKVPHTQPSKSASEVNPTFYRTGKVVGAVKNKIV